MSIRPLHSNSSGQRGDIVLGIPVGTLGPGIHFKLACSIAGAAKESGVSKEFPMIVDLISDPE